MKILFLVPNPVSTIPGQRFRFEQYLSFLSDKGIIFKICPFVSANFHKIIYKKGRIFKKCLYTIGGFFYRVMNIFQALNYDLIFIYREITPLGPPIFETILCLMGKSIVYDFDDAIFLPSSSDSNKFITFLEFPQKTSYLIRLSKLVLVGNINLKNYALKFNKNVLVSPTVINTDLYTPKKNQEKKRVCLGWSGSLTTLPHLDLFKDAIKKVYSKYDIDVKVIGSKEFSIPGVDVNAQDWKLETELDDLRQLDIGIMPLPDDDWGRGKCGLKALQYMALEIPAVCSPVGVNAEIIKDGVNGFLCRDMEEWVEKISLLVTDRQLRDRLGAEGRKTIEDKYSVRVNAPKFLDALQSICNK